jgi:hypothetical protein
VSAVRWLCLCILLSVLAPEAARAAAADAEPGREAAQAWLVTYGPGEIYWQRFGHNAIWIRDSARGLDHVFNFGFFDFAQQDFILRFLQGRMLYFSAAQPATEEFAAYIDENRSIRAQRLDLSPARIARLTGYLLEEVRPENRDYLYDYYLNNCSTRVREAIDLAIGGDLSAASQSLPASQTWRDHTRRLTRSDFWLYLGLEIALGARVDRPVSRWDEMFIPQILADAVASLETPSAGDPTPLVVEDVLLFESSLPPPPAQPRGWWPRYLLASLTLLAAGWLASRWAGALLPALASAWFLIAGSAGVALLFLWFGTDHAAAGLNLNVLVLNPLWLWLGLRPHPGFRALPLVAGFAALALVLPFLPPHQYTLDVLAAFLPLNLAAAAVVDGRRASPAAPLSP